MEGLRVVSLLSSGTEILFALGAGEQIVGVSHECDFPPPARHLPQVTHSRLSDSATSRAIDDEVRANASSGTALYEIDTTALCRLAPALIVTQSQCDVCAVRYEDVIQLLRTTAELSDATVVDLNPQSLGDLFLATRRIGAALDRNQQAEHVIQQWQQRLESVRIRTAALSTGERPRVVCVEWVDPLMVAANWIPELVEIAGGQNGLSESGRHSEYVEWDQIRTFDPDVLIVMPCGFDLDRSRVESDLLRQLPGWQELAAIQRGRVYAVDANSYFTRSGPRLVDSVEILAHLLHPHHFADPGLSAWEQVERA